MSDVGALRRATLSRLEAALAKAVSTDEVPGTILLFSKFLGVRGTPHTFAGEVEQPDRASQQEAAAPRFGRPSAGHSSTSPNFRKAMRPAPGISRHDVVLPGWVQDVLDKATEAHPWTIGSSQNKPAKKSCQLTDAIHALATFGYNEFGVGVATSIAGFYPEMGSRLAIAVPYDAIVGGDAIDYGSSIQTFANSIKRGGLHGKVIKLRVPSLEVQSPLKKLAAAGKVQLHSPSQISRSSSITPRDSGLGDDVAPRWWASDEDEDAAHAPRPSSTTVAPYKPLLQSLLAPLPPRATNGKQTAPLPAMPQGRNERDNPPGVLLSMSDAAPRAMPKKACRAADAMQPAPPSRAPVRAPRTAEAAPSATALAEMGRGLRKHIPSTRTRKLPAQAALDGDIEEGPRSKREEREDEEF